MLYGVSYGTKVALDYAAQYPAHVEALVLDSVVPPEGPDVARRSTLQGGAARAAQLCAGGACAGITHERRPRPRALVAQVERKPQQRHGHHARAATRLTVRLDQDGLLDILLAGDLNPTLRAELPGAVRGALRGDRARCCACCCAPRA